MQTFFFSDVTMSGERAAQLPATFLYTCGIAGETVQKCEHLRAFKSLASPDCFHLITASNKTIIGDLLLGL